MSQLPTVFSRSDRSKSFFSAITRLKSRASGGSERTSSWGPRERKHHHIISSMSCSDETRGLTRSTTRDSGRAFVGITYTEERDCFCAIDTRDATSGALTIEMATMM